MFNSTIMSCIQKGLDTAKKAMPSLRGGSLGFVRYSSAKRYADVYAKSASKQTAAEIMAEYNKVTIKGIDGVPNKFLRTTTKFNDITHEIIEHNNQGELLVTNYKRTTPRGTYEVKTSRETGLVTSKTYTSPTGKVRHTPYDLGKPIKYTKDIDTTIAEWKQKRGQILSRESDSLGIENFTTITYSDGSKEKYIFEKGKQKPINWIVELRDRTVLNKSYDNNITYLMKSSSKPNNKGLVIQTIYQNPETGEIAIGKLTKGVDEFGRNVRIATYSFPEGSKVQDAVFEYAQTGRKIFGDTEYKLSKASYKYNNELRKLENTDKAHDFETTFLGALEEIGIHEQEYYQNPFTLDKYRQAQW